MATNEQRKIVHMQNQALEKSRRILDRMEDGIAVVNEKDELEYCNAAFEKIFGPVNRRTFSECIGESMPITPRFNADSPVYPEPFSRGEWHYRQNERNYDVLAFPCLGEDGRLARMEVFHEIAMNRIATERGRGEDRFRAVVDSMNEGVAILNQNEVFIYVNRRLCEMLGYVRDDLIGKPLSDHLDEFGKIVVASRKPIRRKGDLFRNELLFVRKNGSTFNSILSQQALIDREGWLKGSSAVIVDITGIRSKDGISARTDEATGIVTSSVLESQEAERRRISRNLHDEVGQALTVVKLQVGLIIRELTGEQAQLREDCIGALGHIDEILDQVRRLARELSPSLLEDVGLCAALRGLLQVFTRSNKIKISAAIGDVDRLFDKKAEVVIYRIFQEALSNISRHSAATSVTAVVEREGSRVMFLIEDNGTGFEVARLSQYPARGGLGIAALRERVSMLGGSLSFQSEVGKGTRIQFSIPIADGENRC